VPRARQETRYPTKAKQGKSGSAFVVFLVDYHLGHVVLVLAQVRGVFQELVVVLRQDARGQLIVVLIIVVLIIVVLIVIVRIIFARIIADIIIADNIIACFIIGDRLIDVLIIVDPVLLGLRVVIIF